MLTLARRPWKAAFVVGIVVTIALVSIFLPIQLEASQAVLQGSIAAGVTTIGLILMQLTPRRFAWWQAVILLAIVIPLSIGGFWYSVEELGISDWDYYFSLHHTIRSSLLDHGTFPFWNPYICGGTAGLGDPEFSLFTPTFLLELIFGIPSGFRLAIYLATFTGATGMLFLGRRLGWSVYGALLSALIFALGSVNLLEIVEGHPNVFAAGWIPWVFWAWLGAYRAPSRRSDIICGLFLALTFYQGGIYLLMYTALAFIVLPLLVRRTVAAIFTTIRAGAWALGFAALKLIPVLLWLRQFQDEMYAGSMYSLPYLHKILFGRYLHDAEVFANQGSGWHEYGAYVGIGTALLALFALPHIKQRLIRALIIAVVIPLFLSSTGPLLKPFFDQAPFFPRSNISRIILFSVIPLSLLAGFGLDTIRRKLPQLSSLVTPTIIGLIALDLATLAYALSLQAFVLPPVVPAITPAPWPLAYIAHSYQTRHNGDDYNRAYNAILAGYGTQAYCSVLTPPIAIRTIHDEEDNGLLSLENKQATYSVTSWSPTEVIAQVNTPEQTAVVLNANYAKGWYVNNSAAQEIGNRVGTRVEAGDHQLTFRYRSPGFVPGLIVTLLSIGLAIILLVKPKIKHD